MRGFYECFCVSPSGGGRVGPPLTRPSPIEYFDLVSKSYAVVAIFSVACVKRARLCPFRLSSEFYFAFLFRIFRALLERAF